MKTWNSQEMASDEELTNRNILFFHAKEGVLRRIDLLQGNWMERSLSKNAEMEELNN